MSLNIRVIAPDGLVWDTTADGVVLPSLTGQLGILTGHAPLITSLEIGILRIKVNSKWTPIIVLGGFAVIMNDEIQVLISGVEEVVKDDYAKAKEILAQAKKNLDLAKTTKEIIDASQELKIASAKVKAFKFI
uniref:ATP synthase epsilon chain, chloroplastic n=2 Tax=Scytosiphon TaxID=27966 RepID=A0A7T8G5D8_SCYLO|nr:ATP synthase CF1 subunit epsilon [Scytosiphon promiscuus]YP_010147483.1 ATP synthase CF1 subunit epsilon [Scytosiphon lomentaria]QDM58385.1 ATP synthase CF1 subunit epsilon [Scytosiphon promiscuus]QDM58528.1 ATP synthase CF1 subunit epsilon [Scytosiphon promiscuus]QQP22224.1 ATP synthase CF1 subunit epsilon [Scytosiphon lomentaria]QTW91513.1 ATP synthase CF1 epsilon subunit [Scytosiphon lomentaria]WAM64623.1 ATP synthase CF1, subunit epsilon [Scytosiphon lomentaria]